MLKVPPTLARTSTIYPSYRTSRTLCTSSQGRWWRCLPRYLPAATNTQDTYWLGWGQSARRKCSTRSCRSRRSACLGSPSLPVLRSSPVASLLAAALPLRHPRRLALLLLRHAEEEIGHWSLRHLSAGIPELEEPPTVHVSSAPSAARGFSAAAGGKGKREAGHDGGVEKKLCKVPRRLRSARRWDCAWARTSRRRSEGRA
mmetsp:Transcript_11425/g.20195  ORF Transcript_11425/g.20195 Transcript_11425/m.20195 type:complete len:201 (+) Transcript_11425:1527-2129(+)